MQMWTDEETERLMPYVLRRIHPEYLDWVAREIGRHRAEVRRQRRALRHQARRVQRLAGRAGRLAA